MKQEVELRNYLLAMVVNPKSEYFGESFYMTHKVETKSKTWYRCKPKYYVKGVDKLWFTENEIEFIMSQNTLWFISTLLLLPVLVMLLFSVFGFGHIIHMYQALAALLLWLVSLITFLMAKQP